MSNFFYITAVCSTLLWSMNAKAANDWQSELNSLREDVRVLQRQLYRSDDVASANLKNNENVSTVSTVNLAEYDDVLRKINGRLDVLEYDVKQVEDKIEKLNRDFNIRFKILEGRNVPDNMVAPVAPLPVTYDAPVAKSASKVAQGEEIVSGDLPPLEGAQNNAEKQNIEQSSGLSASGSIVVDGVPQSIVPENVDTKAEEHAKKSSQNVKPLSAKEMYSSGMEAMNAGYVDEAELAFEHILKEFPKDKLAGNAQYWLGDIYYKQGNFNKAKLAFKNSYEKYHDGYKAPDSLFKLGMTMKSLKDNKRACIVFLSFPEEFPQASADLKKKVKSEATKLGCK